jgi:hypothetical protein
MKGHTRRRPLLDLFSLLCLRRRLPIIALVLLCAQSFWWMFDRLVTSQIHHKVGKVYDPPTESSPIAPYYTEAYSGFARAFPIFPHPFPCGTLGTSTEQQLVSRRPTKEGLLYIKEMMTGSTTLAGITARIARNMGQRLHPQRLPKTVGANNTNTNNNNSTTTATMAISSSSCTARLVPMKARRLRERIAEKSFLWSVVREPVQRVVSKFFHFAVSGEGVEPTVKKLQTFVWDMENADYAYYFKSLSLRQSLNTATTCTKPMSKKFCKAIIFSWAFPKHGRISGRLAITIGVGNARFVVCGMISTATSVSSCNRQNDHGNEGMVLYCRDGFLVRTRRLYLSSCQQEFGLDD